MNPLQFTTAFDACVGHGNPIDEAVQMLVSEGAVRSRAIFEKWKRETTFSPAAIAKVEKNLYG